MQHRSGGRDLFVPWFGKIRAVELFTRLPCLNRTCLVMTVRPRFRTPPSKHHYLHATSRPSEQPRELLGGGKRMTASIFVLYVKPICPSPRAVQKLFWLFLSLTLLCF